MFTWILLCAFPIGPFPLRFEQGVLHCSFRAGSCSVPALGSRQTLPSLCQRGAGRAQLPPFLCHTSQPVGGLRPLGLALSRCQVWGSAGHGEGSPSRLKMLLPLTSGGIFIDCQVAIQPGKLHEFPGSLPLRWGSPRARPTEGPQKQAIVEAEMGFFLPRPRACPSLGEGQG